MQKITYAVIFLCAFSGGLAYSMEKDSQRPLTPVEEYEIAQRQFDEESPKCLQKMFAGEIDPQQLAVERVNETERLEGLRQLALQYEQANRDS